jgi:hypothetical protein
MLEFGTVDLYDSMRIAKENFRRRLDDPCLTRARRPEEKHCADRTRRVVHPGEVDLKQSAHAPDGAFLADDPA